jgi:hypothetical protein
MNQNSGPPQGQYSQGRPSQGQYGQNPYGHAQPGPNSGWDSSPRAGTTSTRTPAVVTLARVLLPIAAAVALAYGVFAILLLRGVYSDFDSGDATLGEVDDRLDIHNVAVWVAFVVVVAALVTWAVAAVTIRRGTKAVGLAGMVVTVVAAAVAGFGLVRMTGADNGDDAAMGVLGLLAVRGPSTLEAPAGSYSSGYGQGQHGQSPPGYRQPSGPYGQQPGQPGQHPYGGPPNR